MHETQCTVYDDRTRTPIREKKRIFVWEISNANYKNRIEKLIKYPIQVWNVGQGRWWYGGQVTNRCFVLSQVFLKSKKLILEKSQQTDGTRKVSFFAVYIFSDLLHSKVYVLASILSYNSRSRTLSGLIWSRWLQCWQSHTPSRSKVGKRGCESWTQEKMTLSIGKAYFLKVISVYTSERDQFESLFDVQMRLCVC